MIFFYIYLILYYPNLIIKQEKKLNSFKQKLKAI